MAEKTVELYGGPLDGEKRPRTPYLNRGYCGPWRSRQEFYLFDGVDRFVWSGTLEGHLLQAEVESKKRGGANG